jgi:cyclophilin family peptidyl-prolyl cis-trans isomerase
MVNKDTDRLTEAYYQEGEELYTQQRFAEALPLLRQARELHKTHYKDVDELIVAAQTAVQKARWAARPADAVRRKGCFLFGALALALAFTFVASACTPIPAPAPCNGAACKLSPTQRENMYQAAPPMTIDVNKKYTATIKTSKGDIVVALDAQNAPMTTNNFIFLARDGFYDGLTFHRVEPGFVIQGGDPRGGGTGGPGYTIPGEFKLKHPRGAIAMARLPDQINPKKDSSGSQFYITLAATPGLDGQYSAFGQVTSGMDVVLNIAVGDVIQGITISE